MNLKIIEQILSKSKIPELTDLLVNKISFGELQSLLLKIYELKTRKKSYINILKEYHSNRFTKPSDINPIVKRKLELDIFSLLPEDFELIDLSPLAPLGTSSVLTTVHQNNIVSTIRNVEAAADTTNMLALECARRRDELLKKDKKSTTSIKLCSSQCLTRAQSFENKNFSAHFNVVAIVTAGKDEGNDRFESVNLLEHIRFYIHLLIQLIESSDIKSIAIKFFEYEGFSNSSLIEPIKKEFANNKLVIVRSEKNSEFGKNYYNRLRFMIGVINQQDQEFDYIDGGFTDWTAKLLGNKKERLLTSGIGTDFLLRTVKIKKPEKFQAFL